MVAAPLLLLVARDLLLHDPPRVLAWRLLHEARLQDLPGWLRALVPGGGAQDRDPLALLLGACCSAVALALVVSGLLGAGPRVRAALLALGAVCAVILPTVSLVAMGWAMDRPYGQDGGVVQLPLALDLLLQGKSPYGADYSASLLGRQARVSPFWQAYGGNPLLHHHAYLPGTHLVMLPAYLLARGLGLAFDARMVTLLALAVAAWLGAKLATPGWGPQGALAAAAVVLVNPLVYWPLAFGANDIVQAALLLAAVELARRGRAGWCGAVLGLACASKQLAWPYAPFLLAHLSGATTLRGLFTASALRRVGRPLLAALAVFAAVVVPVLALDPRGFWGDIVVYNVGLPGADSYPLGGTPGFGVANFLLYYGRVASLRDHVSFAPFYAVLVPLCLLLLRRQLREAHPAAALVTGSAALLASVYVSRVAHPNYLVPAAILLPIGLLACSGGAEATGRVRRWTADAAVGPLLLLLLAVELVESEALRAVWEDAVAARLPLHAIGLATAFLPRGGPHLMLDPLGLFFAAIAAGLAVAWLMAALLGAPAAGRCGLAGLALAAVVFAPALVIARVGAATGTPRAQDPWLAPVSRAARQAAGQSDPAPVREAWSSSFRRDPPAALDGAAGSPPQRALGRALGALGMTDPRPLLVLCVVIAGALAAVWIGGEAAPLALAAVALVPPAALGAVFGAGEPLALVLLVAALALGRVRALLLGAGAALFPRLALAAPLPLAPGGGRRRWLAALGAFAIAAAAVVAVAGPRWPTPMLVPAVGLPNVLLYAGVTSMPRWVIVAGVAAMGALVAALAARPLPAAAVLPATAAVLLAWLWLWPTASPEATCLPIALLVLSPLAAGRFDSTGAGS